MLSLRVTREDLRLLLDTLQAKALAAATLELTPEIVAGRTPQEIASLRDALREAYTFFITVSGFDGSQLSGTIESVFGMPSFPADVATVFVDSATKFRNQKRTPRNYMTLFIDFQRPAIFNFNLMPSHATENASNFKTWGLDEVWVRGVYHEVESFVKQRTSGARWLHKHSIYDVLLFCIGFPFAFWLAYRSQPLVLKLGTSQFVAAAGYVYVWMAALWGFRALFHYARWIWPLIEYSRANSRASVHRGACGLLATIFLFPAAYDLAKALFSLWASAS